MIVASVSQLLLGGMIGGAQAADPNLEESIVHIQAKQESPMWLYPWMRQDHESTSTGCVVSDDLIITTASSVTFATEITVRTASDPQRWDAEVFKSRDK